MGDRNKIKILSYDVAERLCKKLNKAKNVKCAVISINDYGFSDTDIKVGGGVFALHKMKFADIDPEEYAVTEKFGQYIKKHAAKPEDLHGLKKFVDEVKDECDRYIIHCAAGYSRSPAVASALEEYLGLPDTVWNSGKYYPNRHVYKLVLKEFGIEKSDEEINSQYKALDDLLNSDKTNI